MLSNVSANLRVSRAETSTFALPHVEKGGGFEHSRPRSRKFYLRSGALTPHSPRESTHRGTIQSLRASSEQYTYPSSKYCSLV